MLLKMQVRPFRCHYSHKWESNTSRWQIFIIGMIPHTQKWLVKNSQFQVGIGFIFLEIIILNRILVHVRMNPWEGLPKHHELTMQSRSSRRWIKDWPWWKPAVMLEFHEALPVTRCLFAFLWVVRFAGGFIFAWFNSGVKQGKCTVLLEIGAARMHPLFDWVVNK